MSLVFYWAEKLSRGCGWFAVCVGTALGLAFGVLSQKISSVDPGYTHQILTLILFGHLPTFFVSAFVLLRVSFQLATDSDMRADVRDGEQMSAYGFACALVSVMAWIWFFLAVMFGCWLGMMYAFGGYAESVWISFWVDFDLVYLLHAALRMVLLALSLSALAFFELNFLRVHHEQLGMLMSRSMTLGMALIVGIELLDLSLM